MSIVAINAKHSEEIRVATCDKQQISDLYIENTLRKTSLKDIYAGVVRSIEPSLGAVFVEYGSGRHGFLQFKDIALEYSQGGDRQNLKTSLKTGQSIIVQIKKEERGTKGRMKGAALTTYVTLPGTYLVLMPNHPRSGGVSKQIIGDARKDMQDVINQLNPPSNMSVILRTAGANRPIEDLQKDLMLLLRQWDEIKKAFETRKAPFLIFQEGDILARTIRDYVREEVTEIMVDDPTIFEKTREYATKIRPDLIGALRLYKGRVPLFLHLGIEDEVESAFQRAIRLPSGGSVIFDMSEALIAIDVNSGSSTKHGDITETALKTNLEAAEMIARQLRLRDLGGLIVIDFIGMKEDEHKRQVEAKLWESTLGDRARIQIEHILPRFDVLVMSRQRLRSSLGRVNEDICPVCQGRGIQRSIESLALSVIRAVEKKLFLKKVGQIRIEASVALITYLSNEKRNMIYTLEQEHQFRLLLLPNPHWEASQYKITSFSREELAAQEEALSMASHALLSDNSKETMMPTMVSTVEVPAVERFSKRTMSQPSTAQLGFIKKLLNKITGWGKVSRAPTSKPELIMGRSDSVSRSSGGESSYVKPKKPARRLSMAIDPEGMHSPTRERSGRKAVHPGGEVFHPVVAEKKAPKRFTKRQPLSSDVSPVKLAGIPDTGIDLSKVGTEPMNAPLASGLPYKRSAIQRYGGEARLQGRGYQGRRK